MLPRVILHNAVSVDGRIDWFTPDIGRFYELASRWNEDATLAGSDTLLKAYSEQAAPEPDLQAGPEPEPEPDASRPLLVVPDSRGRLRLWHLLRREPYWRDAVALCSRSARAPPPGPIWTTSNKGTWTASSPATTTWI